MQERRRFAIFIDYENIAIGIRDSRNRDFRYEPVLEWVRSRGEVLTQVAYGTWSSHLGDRQIQSRLAAHGVRMEHLETTPRGDKNGADIALALDALELVFTQKHIDSFCIVSGDSDFLPLIHKLKRHNKRVYICASQDTVSANLRRNCNEFVTYEELLLAPERPKPPAGRKHRHDRLEEAFPYVKDAIRDMHRRGEMPFMNELSDHIAYRERDLDPRSFDCSNFKDLIYALLEAGYLWRKPVGQHMFCVAISDRYESPQPRRAERPLRNGRPRRAQPQLDFRAQRGSEHSNASDVRPTSAGARTKPAPPGQPDPAGSAVALPEATVLGSVLPVLERALGRIENDGRVAELGLLYKTALQIDPNFKSYGVRRMAFQPLLEQMARQGLFSLSEADGRVVVVPVRRAEAAPTGLPAQPDAAGEALAEAKGVTSKGVAPARAMVPSVDLEFKVGGPVADALALIVPVLRANKELAGPGLSRDELRDAVLEVQPGFKCANYGLKTYRDLFARARNEGLLETRDEKERGMRYFGTARLARVPLADG